MVNTMADLREEVASRLYNTLHGKEIDMMESVEPSLPHMLGVTPLGKIHDPENESMTLMDSRHPFWDEYEQDIETKNQATEKLETAIRSLREDGVLEITYPYGEEAEVIYCEVERQRPTSDGLKTSCKECGATITTEPNLEENTGRYYLSFMVDCPECEFSNIYDQLLQRR